MCILFYFENLICRKGGLSKAASADMAKFLLASLAEQNEEPGFHAASAVLTCIKDAVPPHQLLQAALPLVQALTAAPLQVQPPKTKMLRALSNRYDCVNP